MRLCFFADSHGSSIVDLVKKVKRYFAPSATNEIWEVLRPTMCMHDHLLFKTQGFLCLFLPTTGDHITWLDELMSVWSWVGMCRHDALYSFSVFCLYSGH